MKMSLLSGTLVVTLCIVFTNASSLLEKDQSELLLDDSELLERTPRDVKYNFPHNRLPRPTPLCFRQPCKLPSTFLKPLLIRQPRSLTPYEDEVSVMEDELESLDRRPRDVKFTFPGQNRIPPPPTALCFRQPCNVPGGFRGPTQQRHRRSVAIQPNEDEVTVMEDEIESLDRRPRDVKFTFPGQNRIPPPPTALCFRQPCNVPGGFRGPTQQRHRRSIAIESDEDEVSVMEEELESLDRRPRDVKFTFPGQNRIPPPPTALCFRQPCNVPGGFRGPTQQRHRRSIAIESDEDEVSVMEDEIESLDRKARDVKFTFPGQNRIPPPPTALCFREPCNLPRGFQGPVYQRHRRSIEPDEESRIRRSPGFDDKGFRDFTPETNTRGMLHGSKSFGPNSHGGWVATGKVEHDFWKSNDGNQRLSGYLKQDRVLGGRFDGFKDTSAGIGYSHRFRRSPYPEESNTRGMIYSTKSFGPNSHGGWQSTAKVEHDIWKSKDGNQKFSGYIQHDRIDGGRFDGNKDTKAGLGFSHRFRRSPYPEESNTRGMIYSTKSFGPNSHGGWQSTAKVEHDIWKSKDGNQKFSGYIQHDRIDGGRFDGNKDTKAGLGFSHRFRRSPYPEESNTRGMIYSTKSFGPNSHGGWQSTAKVEHDIWKSKDGNQKLSGYIQHDRIDGGRFDGNKDTKAGIGYSRQF
ncbi:uncharacterized protein LOC142329438 [Lycorma delicatula]|uniref:uncharacterized protein LOC142329438 n=1 Tax=Lycorma delicatula TaxID=130591 RepID=UPI003F512DF2